MELESYRLEFYENFNYLIFSGNTFFPQKIESLRLNFYFVDLESLRSKWQFCPTQLVQKEHKASLIGSSFNVDLEFLKLEMLLSIILSNDA